MKAEATFDTLSLIGRWRQRLMAHRLNLAQRAGHARVGDNNGVDWRSQSRH
jgi:hypothetical protein